MSPRRLAVAALCLVAVIAGAITAYVALRPGEPRFEAIDVTGVPWGRDFALTDHHGRPHVLTDFRGKLVMIFFGYTHCPDICPTRMASLGEDAKDVQGLFVTVDSQRDTAEILSQYVPAFHPTFLGLRADDDTTARTASEFKVFFQAQKPNADGFYPADHSGQVFVFDRNGRLRLVVTHSSGPDSIARDLRKLLDEASA